MEQGCGGEAGVERVDADAVRGEFEGADLRQAADAPFAGAVGGGEVADHPGDGGDVHDGGAAVLGASGEGGGEGLEAVEDAGEVDVHDAPPLFDGGVGDARAQADAGVVDQAVQRPGRLDLGGQRTPGVAVGDVQVDGLPRSAGFRECGDEALGRGHVDVGGPDVRPLRGQRQAVGPAEAPGRAGDQDGSACEPAGAGLRGAHSSSSFPRVSLRKKVAMKVMRAVARR